MVCATSDRSDQASRDPSSPGIRRRYHRRYAVGGGAAARYAVVPVAAIPGLREAWQHQDAVPLAAAEALPRGGVVPARHRYSRIVERATDGVDARARAMGDDGLRG